MTGTIAVISDIHSNAPALEAVLRDIGKCGADLIVNLGDSLFGPVDPVGTYGMLAGQRNIVNIMGNCDEALLGDCGDSASYRFVKPLLDGQMETWIREHQPVWTLEDLLFCHGTPWDNTRYLLEEVTGRGVHYKTGEALQKELSDVKARGIVCGHSHVYRKTVLPDGRWAANAGSVGLPAYAEELPFPHVMESGTSCASYCIIRKKAGADWALEHKLVAYDWKAAAGMAEKNGRSDYAAAIATGRVR